MEKIREMLKYSRKFLQQMTAQVSNVPADSLLINSNQNQALFGQHKSRSSKMVSANSAHTCPKATF